MAFGVGQLLVSHRSVIGQWELLYGPSGAILGYFQNIFYCFEFSLLASSNGTINLTASDVQLEKYSTAYGFPLA